MGEIKATLAHCNAIQGNTNFLSEAYYVQFPVYFVRIPVLDCIILKGVLLYILSTGCYQVNRCMSKTPFQIRGFIYLCVSLKSRRLNLNQHIVRFRGQPKALSKHAHHVTQTHISTFLHIMM